MSNSVTIKQIKEVHYDSSKLVAYVDIIVNGILEIRNFKVLRTDDNTRWVSNPQTESKKGKR